MVLDKVELFHDVSLDTERDLKFSRFGYNYGTSDDLFTYISGYKLGLKTMTEYYESLNEGEIEKLDEIVIPIVFQARHIVELYLKLLYMKYVRDKDKHRRVKHIITTTHSLEILYKEIENTLILMCNKAHVSLYNIELKDYIQQLDEIDGGSYAFRYPYDKEMKCNFGSSIAIDVVGFYRKMTQLYLYFDEIMCHLNGYFAKESYDKNLAKYLLNSIKKYRDDMKTVYNIVNKMLEERNYIPNDGEKTDQLSDVTIKQDNRRLQFVEFIRNHEHQELEIINLLLFTGRNLYTQEYRLALNSKEERKEDLKRLLTMNWEISAIHSVDWQSQNYKLLETSEKCLLKWLAKIMGEIKELEII